MKAIFNNLKLCCTGINLLVSEQLLCMAKEERRLLARIALNRGTVLKQNRQTKNQIVNFVDLDKSKSVSKVEACFQDTA